MPELTNSGGQKTILLVGVIVLVAGVVGAVLLLSGGGVTPENELNASFEYSPSSPFVNHAVSFTDTSTGDIVSWSWDFGDGETSQIQNPTHTYTAEGSYTVKLTVTDSSGATAEFSQVITVKSQTTTGDLMVYDDSGLMGQVYEAEVWAWPEPDKPQYQGFEIDGDYTGVDPPEGVKCFRVKTSSRSDAYGGFGIFVGEFDHDTKELIEAHPIDLTPYSSLQFYVKTSKKLKVEIKDTGPSGNTSYACWIDQYGWDSSKADQWQLVTIPASAFQNVDKTQIFGVFLITSPGYSPDLEFMVDQVKWIASE